MSEIYILEPPTFGRVIFDTTCGPLDILLWSKECPKTCLNFVQLCLDGYYNGCTFHTIIKDFIVQTGDPTNTGYGGESIYDKEPFPLEVHPRLMYRYRGLVGLASVACEMAPTDDNQLDPDTVTQNKHGSQFFITLAAASCLNRKNTLFGKVHGDSLFNLLNLAEIPIDKKHHPLDPPYIKSVEVILNPFPALQPRPNSKVALQYKNEMMGEFKDNSSHNSKRKRREVLNCRKKDILSFHVDEEEDEEDIATPETFGTTPPSNSKESQSAASMEHSQKTLPPFNTNINNKTEKLLKLKERIEFHEKNILLKCEKNDFKEDDASQEESNGEETAESDSTGSEGCDELRVVKQARSVRHAMMDQLKSHILSFKKGQGTVEHEKTQKDSVQDANLLTESEKRRQVFLCRRTQTSRRQKEEKELEKFQAKLREAKKKNQQDVDTDNEDNSNWYCGKGLRFAVDSARAYEIDSSKDALTVFDPLAKIPEEAKIKLRNLQHERMMPSLKKKFF